jgi:hypothetical protein
LAFNNCFSVKDSGYSGVTHHPMPSSSLEHDGVDKWKRNSNRNSGACLMAEFLELVQPIVNEDNRATPYFEDYLFQIINTLGGEGLTITTDTQSLVSDGRCDPRLSKAVRDIDGIKQEVLSLKISPRDSFYTKEIQELKNSIASASKARENKLIRRIDELEQIVTSLTTNIARQSNFEKRLDDLEQLIFK